MMLLDLAEAARRSGLTVVEEPGWRTRGHGSMTAVRSITCHHTAGPATGDAPSLAVVRDGRGDLPGPLAHLVLARSGTVHVVAAGVCFHTGGTWESWQSNQNAVGIEAEATGHDGWPAAQYAAYARLCRALADHYGVPYARVLGHREVAKPVGRKVDPNFDMAAFRAAVASSEDDMPTADEIAAAVLARRIRNFHGDTVSLEQIVVATEQRIADAENQLRAITDALGDRRLVDDKA
jgi:hypothetical protein